MLNKLVINNNFNINVIITEVLDLSHDIRQIKALTGHHGQHFDRIVTEVELLGQECELCRKVEDELHRLKNHSQDALGRMQTYINRLQITLDSGKEGCFQMCSHLEDEVRLLRDDVRSCIGQCKSSLDTVKGQLNQSNDRSVNLATSVTVVTVVFGHVHKCVSFVLFLFLFPFLIRNLLIPCRLPFQAESPFIVFMASIKIHQFKT